MIEQLETRVLCARAPLPSAAGHLDTAFGDGTGQVIVQFPVSSAFTVVRGSATQPDGKTVIVGELSVPSIGTAFGVARINPDGTLDTTFGAGGLTTLPQIGNADAAFAVTLQDDGKILVGGGLRQTVPQQPDAFSISVVARLNSDGTLDPGFGDGGLIEGQFNNNTTGTPFGEVRSIAIQSDGNIVVVGAVGSAQNLQGAFARYLPDGTLDTTFGSTGIEFLPTIANPVEELFGAAIQPDGNIVAVGASASILGSSLLLVRLDSAGNPDPSFGGVGAVLTPSPFNGSGNLSLPIATAVTVQPDGKIVLGGFDLEVDPFGGGVSHALAARYFPDGSLDPKFGTAGIAEANFPDFDTVQQIRLTADGRILASGLEAATSQDAVNENFGAMVFQLQPNGQLDTSFGQGGRTVVAFQAAAPALQFAPADTSSTGLQQQLQNYQSQVATIALTNGGEIQVIAGDGSQVNDAHLIGNGPELSPVLSGIKPGNLVGGAPGTAVVTIVNNGNDIAAGDIEVDIYLSPTNTVDPSAEQLVDFQRVLRIPASVGKASEKIPFHYANDLPDGDYYLVVQVSSNAFTDADPSNNVTSTPFTVGVAQPFVSLSGQFAVVPVAVSPGSSTRLAIELTNSGNVTAQGVVAIQILASPESTLGSDAILLGTLPPTRVQMKTSTSRLIRLTLPATGMSLGGDFYIVVAADLTGVNSSDEPQLTIVSGSPTTFS
jgi:uncharacterized delta-60 repeat protein